MDINKAIKKQKKSYKRFVLTMCFIFFALPIILYLSGNTGLFFIIYLGIIELLVLLSIITKIDQESLSYQCEDNKIKIRVGIRRKTLYLSCDKISLVHVQEVSEDMELILITTSRFRNKKIKSIDTSFMKKYSYMAHEYTRLKKLYPEEDYYYIIIKSGGLIKYKLLLDMYITCVRAAYTEEAIESIKKWKK